MSDLRELLGKHYSQKRHGDERRNRKRYDRSPDGVKSKRSNKKPSRRYTEAEDHNKNYQESREVTLGDRSQEILISISGRNTEDPYQLPSLSTEGGEKEHLMTVAKLKNALKTIDEKDKEIKRAKRKG